MVKTLPPPPHYRCSISGFWILLQKFLPWMSKVQIPSMTDISQQLAFVASVKTRIAAEEVYSDLFIRPAVSQYGIIEFNKYKEIVEEVSGEVFFL